jgi:hypothetical protein
MGPILNLLLQIKMLGQSVSILLTSFCGTQLNGNYLALSWTVRLPVKSGLLCCLPTYEHKTNENLHELQKKLFYDVILPEQSLTDFIASLHLILHLILSDLVALSDKTFNEDTIISKLLLSS